MNVEHIQKFCCEINTAHRLERISDFFKRFSEHDVESYEQTVEHYQSEFRNDITSIDDVVRVLGRKWKQALRNRVYPFLHHLYFTTSNGPIVERPISCFNKKLVDTLGNDSNVRKARRDMVLLDCLKCVKDSWWFGKKEFNWYGSHAGGIQTRTSKFESKAKVYIINRVTVCLLYKMCVGMFGELNYNQQNGVNVSMSESENIVVDNKISVEQYLNKIRVASKLGIDVRPFNVHLNGKKGTEGRKLVQALVNVAVTTKHPFIKHFMSLREDLNKNLPQRTKGVFELNCHYSPSGCHLTKVGIRDYNECCNLKAHDSKELVKVDESYQWNRVVNEKYNGERFMDVAKDILNTETVWEYDVKSSVPRVLWLLKTGQWMPQEKDIYELILGAPFKSKIARDCFKRFCLIALFSSSTEEMMRNIKPAFTDAEWKLYKVEIGNCIAYVKDRLEILFGIQNDTLVFAHESCIYMLVEQKLQQLGVSYIKKFDCFYTNKEVPNINEIITQCANQYYQTWVNNNKSVEREDSNGVSRDNGSIQLNTNNVNPKDNQTCHQNHIQGSFECLNGCDYQFTNNINYLKEEKEVSNNGVSRDNGSIGNVTIKHYTYNRVAEMKDLLV